MSSKERSVLKQINFYSLQMFASNKNCFLKSCLRRPTEEEWKWRTCYPGHSVSTVINQGEEMRGTKRTAWLKTRQQSTGSRCGPSVQGSYMVPIKTELEHTKPCGITGSDFGHCYATATTAWKWAILRHMDSALAQSCCHKGHLLGCLRALSGPPSVSGRGCGCARTPALPAPNSCREEQNDPSWQQRASWSDSLTHEATRQPMNVINTGNYSEMSVPSCLALQSLWCSHLSVIIFHSPNRAVFPLRKRRKAVQKIWTTYRTIHSSPHSRPWKSHAAGAERSRTRSTVLASFTTTPPGSNLILTHSQPGKRTLRRRLCRWNSIINNEIKLVLNLLLTHLTWLY